MVNIPVVVLKFWHCNKFWILYIDLQCTRDDAKIKGEGNVIPLFFSLVIIVCIS